MRLVRMKFCLASYNFVFVINTTLIVTPITAIVMMATLLVFELWCTAIKTMNVVINTTIIAVQTMLIVFENGSSLYK
jgi:hypothetical protein